MELIRRLGMVGLGKMGAGMMKRLLDAGLDCGGFDPHPGLRTVDNLISLVEWMEPGHRVIWLMMPLKPYESTLNTLHKCLVEGDMIIDGGNTNYKVTQERHARFERIGVHYVDVGTSGGIFGPVDGYPVMVGATSEEYDALRLVLTALKPEQDGLVHVGPSGAGHFAKMVHNAIEYGQMASFAEGFVLMYKSGLISDVLAVLKSWRHGSIVESRILNFIVMAIERGDMDTVAGIAENSGEGKWAAIAAMEMDIPMPVLDAALNSRFYTKGDALEIMGQLLAIIRREFGGHPLTLKAELATV